MPALARTSAEAVVTAALAIVEREGADALSMQAVASAVGIKGPSLYKRYADRELLLDDVVRAALQDLEEKLAAARKKPGDPLHAMARAFRAYALKRPRLYPLLFAARREGGDLQARRAELVQPLLGHIAGLVGEAHALDGARLFTAWLHGFISMELGGAFQMGGSVEQAFEFGLEHLVAGLRR
jgi:AcrR family transcriptional regulator